jgi:hypothetical protein
MNTINTIDTTRKNFEAWLQAYTGKKDEKPPLTTELLLEYVRFQNGGSSVIQIPQKDRYEVTSYLVTWRDGFAAFQEPGWFYYWLKKIRWELNLPDEEETVPAITMLDAVEQIRIHEHTLKGVLLKITTQKRFRGFCAENAQKKVDFGKGLENCLLEALAPEEATQYYNSVEIGGHIIALRDEPYEITIAKPMWIEGLEYTFLKCVTYGEWVKALDEYYGF